MNSQTRAALCSFVAESQDLSERSKSANNSVRIFLAEVSKKILDGRV